MTPIPPPRCALCHQPVEPEEQVPWGRGQKRGVAHRECAERAESGERTRQRLVWRAGDIKARNMMLGWAEAAYGEHQYAASASLVHAEAYLADRLAYELAPWPKNQIKLETREEFGF